VYGGCCGIVRERGREGERGGGKDRKIKTDEKKQT
jgi:hypothetical protein